MLSSELPELMTIPINVRIYERARIRGLITWLVIILDFFSHDDVLMIKNNNNNKKEDERKIDLRINQFHIKYWTSFTTIHL